MSSQRTAATLLDAYLDEWLATLAGNLVGVEQLVLVELIRSADVHAYFHHCFAPDQISDDLAYRCVCIEHGIGPILVAFLPKLEQYGDGIPWAKSTPELAAWADNVLFQAGRLAMLRRLAHSERYGLASCEIHSDRYISIHITAGDEEALDREDHVWLIARAFDRLGEYQDTLTAQIKGWARDRIDRYVRIHQEHFIGYDSDWELLRLYQEQARLSMIKSAEADAFPDEVKIGPRTFGEWKQIAVTAVARATLHISFASRLKTLNEGRLDIRNLLTMWVRQDDLRDVWRDQTGVATDHELDDISDIFMLTSVHAEKYLSNLDMPLPYNIRFGKYFAVLPHFGYLNNPGAFLVTELKRKYRKDWDRAVNQREAKFQRDLYKLLPAPSYVPGRENVKVRSAAGATQTDIDAVLFELSTNVLYLFQLKWFDVFGHSLKERHSKLSNLLEANKWVEQVSQWISTIPSAALPATLGLRDRLDALGTFSIRLIVLTRYSARFSGTHCYDERAAWMSWPQLYRLVVENQGHPSPLDLACNHASSFVRNERKAVDKPVSYEFQDLKVDVYS